MKKFAQFADASFSNEGQIQNDISSNNVKLNLTNIPYMASAAGSTNLNAEITTSSFTDSPYGHWKVIQDWTECSLACGGGKQYQQRLCIPGKNPQFGCIGPTVMERPCNTAPCPTTTVIDMDGGTSEQSTVKYVNVSSRPQSYIVHYLNLSRNA